MAMLFCDGFDKYGVAGMEAGLSTILGEWTTVAGSTLVAGRFPGSLALLVDGNNSAVKALPGSYGRLIFGIAFKSTLLSMSGFRFQDGSSDQCALVIYPTGRIALVQGWSPTVIEQWSGSITAGLWHYLEADLNFATGAYAVRLDGAPIMGGTGTLHQTANSTANALAIMGYGLTVDDLYLFDSSGSVNNAMRGDSRVETLFPTADAAVQFTPAAGVLGGYYCQTKVGDFPWANCLYLRKFTAQANGTLTSLGLMTNSSNGTWTLTPAVYADNAGAPSALLGSGPQVVGVTVDVPVTLALTTPVTLVVGTSYWLGFSTGTGVDIRRQDGSSTSVIASASYVAGAPPSSCPTVDPHHASSMIWGNLTGLSGNSAAITLVPPAGDLSYVQSSMVGAEDLYSYGPLSSNPQSIAGIRVTSHVRKSDSGDRMVSLQCKSGTSEAAGAAQVLGASYGYCAAIFETDPATSAAWTAAGVNSVKAGLKVAS